MSERSPDAPQPGGYLQPPAIACGAGSSSDESVDRQCRETVTELRRQLATASASLHDLGRECDPAGRKRVADPETESLLTFIEHDLLEAFRGAAGGVAAIEAD